MNIKKPVADIKTINLQITNACQSKCIMCNVWRASDKNIMPPELLAKILTDPLLKNVKHIGITGRGNLHYQEV